MKRPALWFDGEPSRIEQMRIVVWRAYADPAIKPPKVRYATPEPSKFRWVPLPSRIQQALATWRQKWAA